MRLRFLQSLALTAMLAAGSGTLAAQAFAFDWNPRSGDAWIDTWLGDMNRYGARYRDAFIDELVRYHGAPRELVTGLLTDRHWAPGDLYYACTIAQIVDRPCRDVIDAWTRDHEKGWAVVAGRMGIKPGSAGFRRLKNGFVPTYERWARPITLDAELERVYPEHGKAASRANDDPRGKPGAR